MSRSKSKKNWNYEATVIQIEDIIRSIESGSLPIEEVFTQFEIACALLKECEEFLERGKESMNLLIETLE